MFKNYKINNCLYVESKGNNIKLACKGGQDEFNMPELYIKSNIANITKSISNNFTLKVRCYLYGNSKFDAAGIYINTNNCKCKFGIEFYDENIYKIVTVKSCPFSDESNGSTLKKPYINLIATKQNNIFSFYSYEKNDINFERAFIIDDENKNIDIGFFVQSPLSIKGSVAIFRNINLENKIFNHLRQ